MPVYAHCRLDTAGGGLFGLRCLAPLEACLSCLSPPPPPLSFLPLCLSASLPLFSLLSASLPLPSLLWPAVPTPRLSPPPHPTPRAMAGELPRRGAALPGLQPVSVTSGQGCQKPWGPGGRGGGSAPLHLRARTFGGVCPLGGKLFPRQCVQSERARETSARRPESRVSV